MKVKTTDIARALGISKATVSLALNGKPGVKEETRNAVFQCKAQLEQKNEDLTAKQKKNRPVQDRQIKILKISNGFGLIKNPELDLWTDVLSVFEKYLKKQGYNISINYFDFSSDKAESVADVCNVEYVEGVIVTGTELVAGDYEKIEAIHKPLVIYDGFDAKHEFSYVMIDNRQGIELAVEELFSTGNRDIVYLGSSVKMYNFISRRNGFIESMEKRGIHDARERIVEVSDSIQGCYEFMSEYLKTHKCPQAFLMDTYHISIATIQAMREQGIRVPEDVSLIGVDQLPAYMTGGMKLTTIKVPHTVRGYWAVQLLLREIDHMYDDKCKFYVNCELVKGETIAER